MSKDALSVKTDSRSCHLLSAVQAYDEAAKFFAVAGFAVRKAGRLVSKNPRDQRVSRQVDIAEAALQDAWWHLAVTRLAPRRCGGARRQARVRATLKAITVQVYDSVRLLNYARGAIEALVVTARTGSCLPDEQQADNLSLVYTTARLLADTSQALTNFSTYVRSLVDAGRECAPLGASR